jgi:hypothetical protein
MAANTSHCRDNTRQHLINTTVVLLLFHTGEGLWKGGGGRVEESKLARLPLPVTAFTEQYGVKPKVLRSVLIKSYQKLSG